MTAVYSSSVLFLLRRAARGRPLGGAEKDKVCVFLPFCVGLFSSECLFYALHAIICLCFCLLSLNFNAKSAAGRGKRAAPPQTPVSEDTHFWKQQERESRIFASGEASFV